MNCTIHLSNGNYRFEILDSHDTVVGTAHVESRHDTEGDFWHLEDFLINKDCRSQGYGTALINYLRDYLWNINKLRIRVHPAIGQQVSENLAKDLQSNQQQYTEEELDEMDRKLQERIQQPDFWEEQKKTRKVYNSNDLKKWYVKRGFTVNYPFDERHFWCLPSE